MNPFQLIGSDDGEAPEILALDTAVDGTDLVVTVQIETDDPDFDQLEITVYDAPNDLSHVRRLGYDSRYGIDVAGDNIDTSDLEPNGLSVLTAIQEPDPPVPTSGLTLTARFESLSLASDPNTRVQVKVADVFGNTAIRQIPVFGPTTFTAPVLHLDSTTGLTLDAQNRVARWADQSGNGNDVLQADAGEQPLADGDGIYFATDTSMSIPHAAELNPSSFTVFLVVQPTLEREYAGLLTTLNLGAREGWNLVLRSANLQSDTIATSMQGNGTTTYQGNGGDILMDTTYLVSMRHANPGTLVKVDAGAGSGYADQLISYVADSPLRLNHYYTDLNSTLIRADARYYEVMLFDRALTAAEEASVAGYLMTKWGITSP